MTTASATRSAVPAWVLVAMLVIDPSCSGDDDSGSAGGPTATATSVPTAASTGTARTRTPTASERPEASTPTARPTETPESPQTACDALAGRSFGEAGILSTSLLAGTPRFPESCRVLGVIAPRLNFEIRLPTVWSGRALFIGGFGFGGVIPSPEVILFQPSIAGEGYVTIASDSGHQASTLDASWALGDRPALEDFAYRATHRVLAAARAVVAERYGRDASRTYFIGASEGGREALMAAERWPDDFDGIVALEPVYDLTALLLAMNRVAQQAFAAPGGRLSAAQVETLAVAVLDACDDLDGLSDGIISHVAACHFDAAVLGCTGPKTDRCLTEQQIATVETVRSELDLGFTIANGVRSYPGWPIGHEDGGGGWSMWVVGSSADPSSSSGFVLSDTALRFFVAGDPALDTLRFSPASYEDEIRSLSALVDATDPDLSAFAARGGKLILWHGLADYGVSARSTVRFYERVVGTLGREAVERFLRFYTSPGVDHTNTGPAPGTTDFLGALTAWVEEGEAPGDLVSFRRGFGATEPTLSRPLCRYPAYPRYDGSGDPQQASSFRCVDPPAAPVADLAR